MTMKKSKLLMRVGEARVADSEAEAVGVREEGEKPRKKRKRSCFIYYGLFLRYGLLTFF
jgi:hypothetical protein